MPHAVYSGKDALDKLTQIIGTGVKKTAVFTDRGIIGAGLLELPLSKIKESGCEYVIFDDLAAEPTYEQAQKAVDAFKESGADFIVAVGGGSVMDTAKLASVLATDEYGVKELLPKGVTSATGIDALCHAVECFTSNKKNPFSDIFALQAFEMIMKNIEKACDDPEALKEKNNMLVASFYAGAAITASGTTAVHALSYPLGGRYHIPHGVSNAILLAPVMRFNEPVCRGLFAEAYDRLAAGESFATEAKSEEEKSAWVVNRMEEIVEHLNIPKSLKEFGIGSEDLDELVEAGMGVQRLLVNNMRTVTAEDAKKIYLEII